MTVYKKHIKPDNTTGVCSAQIKCQYQGAEHVYYDSTIRAEVLSPTDPMQKKIEAVPSNELLEKASELHSQAKEPSEEFALAVKTLKTRTVAWEKQKEAIIKSYPVKHQSAVKQMTTMHEGAGMIASFEIFDPEEEDYTAKSAATDDEKMSFAKTYLDKFKAESKVRSLISASHV